MVTHFPAGSSRRARSSLGLLAFLLLPLLDVRDAAGSCDIIPGTLRIFRGAGGSLDRPFARPGDIVSLRTSPVCAPSTPGFGVTAGDNVVSVVFTPPAASGGSRNVVVLATDCATLESQRQACEARSDVASATCLTVNAPGSPAGIEVFTVGQERRLRFRFPDTDALLAPDGDDRTFAGPAAIAVTGVGEPLPCGLASSSCSQQGGMIACVDDLFAVDGSCGTAPNAEFSHFTALPPPNNYQAICTEPSPPCLGTAPEVRFTTDADGNVLVPVDWRGVLLGDAVPVARLVRASSSIEAFAGGGKPMRIPGGEFLRSFSTGGAALPPIFDPQNDALSSQASFFGTADAPETVLRISRRPSPLRQCDGGTSDGLPCGDPASCPDGSCVTAVCAGGANAGTACSSDEDCPAGQCGPALFEFRDRYLSGTGPVIVGRFGAGFCQAGSSKGQPCGSDGECGSDRCVAYRLAAEDPAPIEGLNQSTSVNGFVLAEPIVARDLNGDGDTDDQVVLFSSRTSGAIQAIGSGGADGRATGRVRQSPFSFPMLALTDGILAFLEPEPAQGFADLNNNGQVADQLLRIFRLGSQEVVATTPPRAVDAAPVIDGRSLAVSAGRVFARSVEASLGRQTIDRVSLADGGVEGNAASTFVSVSGDGRWVAFESAATNLVAGDSNGFSDIFVRDVGSGSLVRVSLTSTGAQTTNLSTAPTLSRDGRFVVFQSNANLMIPGEFNGRPDIFVRDRDADADGIFDETGPGETAVDWISQASDGLIPWISSSLADQAISADGRYVAFGSELLPPSGPLVPQLLVRDRLLGVTEIVSVDSSGTPLPSGGGLYLEGPVISGDGRFVAFRYNGTAAVPGDTNGRSDIFVRDRWMHTTERVSLASDGSEANGDSIHFALSEDGRYVAFSSWATNLVIGDTNGSRDVFVRDRLLGITDRVSVGSSGEQGQLDSEMPAISGDGRWVAFRSVARHLVPGTTHAREQIFVHDRLTGLTSRVTRSTSATESEGGGFYVVSVPSISNDGRVIAFNTDASDLVAGDGNGFCDNDPTDGVVRTDQNCSDIFVHHADPDDPSGADLSGDGHLDDVILETVRVDSGTMTSLCPAEETSIAEGRAAFLRPEAAGATPSLPLCPTAPLIGGAPDLNGDGDVADEVVHYWTGAGSVLNLGCAARQVWLSGSHVAALVSEADQGNQSLNGDADHDDLVVKILPLAGARTSSCGAWTSVGPGAAAAADAASLSGSTVALLTPESAQGSDLNDDGDQDDRVLQIFDAATGSWFNTRQAAEDFVLGNSLLAFRTSELHQGDEDLNGDGDTADDVLQVYDLRTRQILSSGQAVRICRLEACDPRIPYRVLENTVKFLTFEPDQGEDLNGNGSTSELLLQVLNVRLAGNTSQLHRARTMRTPGGTLAGSLTVIGVVSSGICTNTAEACNSSADCGGGHCFVPPGGCVRNLGYYCNPAASSSCGEGRFCQATTSTCFEIGDSCQTDNDCPVPATCSPEPSAYRILEPLGQAAEGRGEIFVGAGQCVEVLPSSCALDGDCAAGEFCAEGTCARLQGACAANTDCPQGAVCERSLTMSTARDSDRDELPDPYDNCPEVPNVLQQDADDDGVGDACECSTRIAVHSVKLAQRVAQPEMAALKIKSSDPAITVPEAGSPDDPRVVGAELSVADPRTGAHVLLSLPAQGWRGLGQPAGVQGFIYRDASRQRGPCKLVKVQPGPRPRLQATCKGKEILFTMKGDVEHRLLVQLGLGSQRFCMQTLGSAGERSTGLFFSAGGARPGTWPP